jgi:lysophospholipid acyltransferase (LPLAT)-like uncharacterized protein
MFIALNKVITSNAVNNFISYTPRYIIISLNDSHILILPLWHFGIFYSPFLFPDSRLVKVLTSQWTEELWTVSVIRDTAGQHEGEN